MDLPPPRFASGEGVEVDFCMGGSGTRVDANIGARRRPPVCGANAAGQVLARCSARDDILSEVEVARRSRDCPFNWDF